MPDRLASELMAVHGFARRLVVVNLTDQLGASLHRGLASGPGRRRPLLAVEDRAGSYGASRAAPYRRDPVPRLRRPPHRDSTFSGAPRAPPMSPKRADAPRSE